MNVETSKARLAIEVDHLTKTVPVGFLGRSRTLLSDLSFSVAESAAVAFIGPNGAGKSTTLRHLIGGSRPSSGTVRIFGLNPTTPSARRVFGYLPDLPALPPFLTATETLDLHARLAGVAVDVNLLDQVGLAATSKALTGTFSKGMQTRLGLALALVGSPRLLFLDEPMSGLDPVGRQEVREIIQRQHADGRTVFFSTHVLADVEALCDSVVVINHGRLIFSGSVVEAMGHASRTRVILVPLTTNEALLRPLGRVERLADQYAVIVDVEDPFALVSSLRAQGVTVNEVRRHTPRLEEHVLSLLNPGAR